MRAPRKDQKPTTDPLNVRLGERVSSLRAETSMSAPDLAATIGMDPNYLWRIEQGRQNLSFRNVARLARGFGISLSELLHDLDISDVELASRAYGRQPEAEE